MIGETGELYFACGSGDPSDAARVCVVWLPDCRIRIAQPPQVFPAVGWIVPGLLLQVLPEGWGVLGRKHCLTLDGQVHEAWICQGPGQPGESGVAEDTLFVYGTLLRGESRHRFLGDYRSMVPAAARGTLYDCGDYPAMRLGADGVVYGELVRLRDVEVLRTLDEVEGFRGFGDPTSWFRRTLTEARLPDGRIRVAWVYVGMTALDGSRSRIVSGDWRARNAGP